MEVIIERSDMARICSGLRKKGWQLSSGYGNLNAARLKFSKIEIKPFSSNIYDVLKYMDGEIYGKSNYNRQ